MREAILVKLIMPTGLTHKSEVDSKDIRILKVTFTTFRKLNALRALPTASLNFVFMDLPLKDL